MNRMGKAFYIKKILRQTAPPRKWRRGEYLAEFNYHRKISLAVLKREYETFRALDKIQPPQPQPSQLEAAANFNLLNEAYLFAAVPPPAPEGLEWVRDLSLVSSKPAKNINHFLIFFPLFLFFFFIFLYFFFNH